jgi:tRNA U38,U39,U40 pseudouridine synthase TruA
VLSISGRSFLYHQILSMAGLVIGVVCAALPEAQLDAALSAECGVPVPAAAACPLRSAPIYLSWPTPVRRLQ